MLISVHCFLFKLINFLFISICRIITEGNCALLRTGRCTLSHRPSPTRLPVCIEFSERGTCSASAAASASASVSTSASASAKASLGAGRCPLRHVLYAPNTRTCPRFACYGYCPLGVSVQILLFFHYFVLLYSYCKVKYGVNYCIKYLVRLFCKRK